MSEKAAEVSLNSNIISFIANVDVNEEKADELAKQLAEGISHSNPKLLDLIVALKDHLTSEEEKYRRKALFCLSSILSKIPKDQLTKNEVCVIFSFYLSKVEDEALAKDALNGFSSLVKMKYTNIMDVNSVLDFLINRYNAGSFLAPVRYFTFKIIENIFERFEKSLMENEGFSDKYINAFLHIANGEKDPRNLLISFELNREISSSLPNVTTFKEDLFDVLFCYFPITFKPPKNDPYKISNADLKLALRNAISATPEFDEDAFGNLIDKLTASSPSVKVDTLLTIKACVTNFGGPSCLKHWLPLWNALKFEIMHGSDGNEGSIPSLTEPSAIEGSNNSTFHIALSIMRCLAWELVEVDEHAFDKFLSHVFDELKPNFTYERDLKQSCSVLCSIGSANVITFNKIIDCSLPLILQNTSEIPKLKLLIMNLTFFFDAYITVFNPSNREVHEQIPQNSLNGYKDDILIILGKALTGSSKIETTVRTLSVIQFTKMARMREYLNREEIALILQYLTDTILTDTNKTIYHTCLEGLKTIGENHEDLVYSVSLKRMLDLLPSGTSNEILLSDNETIEKEHILKVILDFTTSKHKLIRESICGLSEKLCAIAIQGKSREYCFLLISSLFTLLSNNIDTLREEDALLIKNSVETSLITAIENCDDILSDNHNLVLLSNVLFFINLKTSKEIHQQALDEYTAFFIHKVTVINRPSRLMISFVKLLCAINKDCEFENVLTVFERVIALLKGEDLADFERLAYLEFLMVLSNKWIEDDSIRACCQWDDKSPINLEILVWINKGLVLKNSALAVEYHKNFIELLSHEEIGSFIANLFEIFVVDIVSMERYKGNSWCNNTRTLYKQKFFCEIFRDLVRSYKDTDNLTFKSNYLTALSLVLKHIPSKLIESYMDEMLPLLLQALEMPTADVKVSALNTLKDTAEKFHQLISEHVQTLVKTLLKLIIPEKYNNVGVRLKSLELLETLSRIVPLNYSQPLKKDIILALEPVLDDKKRIVRNQCVVTRQAFFELGQVPFE